MTPIPRPLLLHPKFSHPYIHICITKKIAISTNVSSVISSITSQYLFRVPYSPSRHTAVAGLFAKVESKAIDSLSTIGLPNAKEWEEIGAAAYKT